MTPRLTRAMLMVAVAAFPMAAAGQDAADLKTSIDRLSAFDYATRMNAARTIRRVQAAEAVPALTEAARSHADQFVRYRALVLLTAFRAPGTSELMQSLLGDRNDRVREVAYRWYEQYPDIRPTAELLAALNTEHAEFVRPALVRALAAGGDNALVQRALIAEAGRGLDFFRSAVIEALGRHQATYAVDVITAVAVMDGPLQDDAIMALGRIGDRRALATLTSLERVAADVLPARHAALCLLEGDCPAQITALVATLRNPTAAPAVTRAAVAALAAIAERADQDATAALFDLAGKTTGRLRDELAVAFASVAVRRPEHVVAWINRAPEAARSAAIDLLRAGFEALEEDYAEEQFFAAVRGAYWAAAEGSSTRTVAAALIDRLEF